MSVVRWRGAERELAGEWQLAGGQAMTVLSERFWLLEGGLRVDGLALAVGETCHFCCALLSLQ